jgi:NADPH:quinone reductase-like Zn-dependent oxidoreductase
MDDALTTRAVVATAYGGPDVLALIETPVPPPGPGEVLINVRAAGTNPADCKFYSGNLGRDPDLLPMRLGLEAAGVVAAVGAGAEGPRGAIRPGDEVVAYHVAGAYADRIVAPGASVVPKPSTLSFEEAAGMMAAGATAVHALAVIGLGAGDTLVIHGASGGVGVVAVQLAAAAGARVIGTASERNHTFLRELGADPVSYGDGLQERLRTLAPEGVDAAIDAVGGDEALDVSLALVADRGRIVTLLPRPRAFEEAIKVIGGRPPSDPGTEIRAAARLELARLAEERKLRIVVSATYPLAAVVDAHRALASGHTRGKMVLVP